MNRIILFVLLTLFLFIPLSASAISINCGMGPAGTCATSPIQGPGRVSSQSVSAGGTAVSVTIAAAQGVRAHIYSVEARCSAGASGLVITDGGTTIWSTSTNIVAQVNVLREWAHGLTGASNSAVVVTLNACSAGGIGTLMVQADQF